MGNSATAQLFFGVITSDPEGSNPEVSLVPWISEETEDKDFSTWLAEQAGDAPPDQGYPDRGDTSEEAVAIRQAYSDYWARCRNRERECPLEEFHFGYMDGYAYSALRLRSWGCRSGYNAVALNPMSLVATNEQLQEFKDAAHALGLTELPEPQVYLTASYG